MKEGKMTVLDELLNDPMVQMVMARDRVRADDLRAMLERDRRRSGRKASVPPAHMIAASGRNCLCC